MGLATMLRSVPPQHRPTSHDRAGSATLFGLLMSAIRSYAIRYPQADALIRLAVDRGELMPYAAGTLLISAADAAARDAAAHDDNFHYHTSPDIDR